MTTIAGSGEPGFGFNDGTGLQARFKNPVGIAVSKDGKTIYVSEKGSDTIRKLVRQ